MSFNVSNRMYRPSMANYQVKFGQYEQNKNFGQYERNKISVEKGEEAKTPPKTVKTIPEVGKYPPLYLSFIGPLAFLVVLLCRYAQDEIHRARDIDANFPYPRTKIEANVLNGTAYDAISRVEDKVLERTKYKEFSYWGYSNLARTGFDHNPPPTQAEFRAYREIKDGFKLISTGAKEVLQDTKAKTKGSKVNKIENQTTENQTTEITSLED